MAPRRFHGSLREPSADPRCNPPDEQTRTRSRLSPGARALRLVWAPPAAGNRSRATWARRTWGVATRASASGAAGPTAARPATAGPSESSCPSLRARAKRRPLQTRQCQLHLLRTVVPDWTSHLKWRLLVALGTEATGGRVHEAATYLVACYCWYYLVVSPVASLASISHSVNLGRLVLRRRHPPYLRHPRHSTTDSGCTRHPSHTPVTVLACREPQQRLGQAVRRRVCNGSLRRSANSQVGNGYGTLERWCLR